MAMLYELVSDILKLYILQWITHFISNTAKPSIEVLKRANCVEQRISLFETFSVFTTCYHFKYSGNLSYFLPCSKIWHIFVVISVISYTLRLEGAVR